MRWACWWPPCTAWCHTGPRGLPRPRWAIRRGGEGASHASSAAESSPPEVQVWYPVTLVIHSWYKWSSPHTHTHTHIEASQKLHKWLLSSLQLVWHVRVWKVLSNIYCTVAHTHNCYTLGVSRCSVKYTNIHEYNNILYHSRLMFDQNITTWIHTTHYCHSNLTEGSDAEALLGRNAFTCYFDCIFAIGKIVNEMIVREIL